MSSIFFDFHLPNSASWFYFSFFLSVALFFRFPRPLTLRNWDLLALFLFVPGFLFIQEANALPGWNGRAAGERFLGYVWLLSASGYWFVRCLIDSAVGQRPLPVPNLATPAMIWLGVSLFCCLATVTFTRPADPWEPVGRRPAVLTTVQNGAASVVATGGGAPYDQAHFWVGRSLATGCHLAVVVGLVLIGVRQFGDAAAGAAAGGMYLLLPYTAYHLGQVHHVWPAALVLWAVYSYRYPTLAGGLLGLAAGTTFFPALLIPAWFQFYRGRGMWRFLGGFAVAWAASFAATAGVLALAGPAPDDLWPLVSLADWQPWRAAGGESIWAGAHWAYRVPVFTVFAAFVLGTAVWPPVRNLGDLIATSAAVLIGVQFWYADRGGLYVLWYAPLLVLLVLKPNLADAVPPVPGAWPGWVRRPFVWVWRRVMSAVAPAAVGVPAGGQPG